MLIKPSEKSTRPHLRQCYSLPQIIDKSPTWKARLAIGDQLNGNNEEEDLRLSRLSDDAATIADNTSNSSPVVLAHHIFADQGRQPILPKMMSPQLSMQDLRQLCQGLWSTTSDQDDSSVLSSSGESSPVASLARPLLEERNDLPRRRSASAPPTLIRSRATDTWQQRNSEEYRRTHPNDSLSPRRNSSIRYPWPEFDNIEAVIAASRDTPHDFNIDGGSPVHESSFHPRPGYPKHPFPLGSGPSPRAHQRLEDQHPTPGSSPSASTRALEKPPGGVSGQRANLSAISAAIDAARVDLFLTLTRKADPDAPKTAALNLATAQRLVLADHQRRITDTCHRVLMANDDSSTQISLFSLDRTLHSYCNSLRDLEYMQEHATRHAKDDELDPFYLKSSKQLVRIAMKDAGFIPDRILPKGPLPAARDYSNPKLPGVSRTMAHRASESEQLWVRFGMASAGGLVLIVPMLIMANLGTKTANLITTCVAIFLFAVGITAGTRLKPDQVLGATAAYAAVLVVFVGTSFST